MSDERGHPLPASEEARHGEIPESAEEEKGTGDDGAELVTPHPRPVSPDGEPYAKAPGSRLNSDEASPDGAQGYRND